jgi:hypothetical protein
MDTFVKDFQIIYNEIKIYEDIRYKLEVERYNKYKKGVPPTTSFTQKTFKWPNPTYETDEATSIANTIMEMKQYIVDVKNIIQDIK